MSATEIFFGNFNEETSVEYGKSRDATIYGMVWNLVPVERKQMLSELESALKSEDCSHITALADRNHAAEIFDTSRPIESTENIMNVVKDVIDDGIVDWVDLNAKLTRLSHENT